jgi:YVTN family beta-propeller protein
MNAALLRQWAIVSVVVSSVSFPAAAQNFVHFESPHVHPVAMTPDSSRLLAVNTAAGRLEVFDVTGAPHYLVRAGSIPVGVEPVTVRTRSNTEAWVVNQISDSVSVVDLASLRVVATLLTGDEPSDVVFAGTPQRAFVSVSQLNRIEVFQPTSLATPPSLVAIAGEKPRALATDGVRVYAAIFESGNETTILPTSKVSSTASPYAGAPNPPPNAGSAFSPAIRPGLPAAPPVSLIVRKDSAGRWRDDNNIDWSAAVTWDLLGHQMAVVNASTLGVQYAKRLMTVPMAVTTLADGRVLAVGTELLNHVRFEPNLKSVFVRVRGALLPAGGTTATATFDPNPHLDYTQRTVAPAIRALSVGDPRAVAVSTDGSRAFVAGLGSNSVAAFNPATGARLATRDVGAGPTGLALDGTRNLLYVLDRFDATVTVLDTESLQQRGRVSFFDPTPAVVRDGRPFLYNTRMASGLGQAACGSCHIDARMDQLAWDLGDPAGTMQLFDQACNGVLQPGSGQCRDFHPMKGPMLTQTLVGLSGEQPFHWRGDRATLGHFAGTTSVLQGADAAFTAAQMQRLQAYLATISFPPNPNRNLDGSLRASVAGGSPVAGQTLYMTGNLAGGQCVTCHALPNGGGSSVISANLLLTTQDMNIPHLRNMHEKDGFDSATSATNRRGFGFAHDGAHPTLIDFFRLPVFRFASGATGDQQRRDVSAFVLSFENGTHASVGAQATLGGSASTGTARRSQLVTIANAGSAQLIAKVVVSGVERGYLYQSATGSFLTA